MQSLKDLVAQLKADNERLRQANAATETNASASASTASLGATAPPAPVSTQGASVERLVFVPRDRKCPMFKGGSGNIDEWEEEVRACMRARHLSRADQAFFIYDHLEGDARAEIKHRPSDEREDPDKVFAILHDLYGCSQSYVSLQETFFSRKQQEGESLLEFSLALMKLMGKVKRAAEGSVLNAEVMLRDQFIEHVYDGSLRRELKQMVRRQPTSTLLDVRSAAIRWEREGTPGAARERSHSLPSAYGIQYGVQGASHTVSNGSQGAELAELKDILKCQQDQLTQLTQSIIQLQEGQRWPRPPRDGPVICRRCQRPGHFARECDGKRVSFRPRSASLASSEGTSNRPISPSQESGN